MITSFIAENYRSIDGEIKLSFMADTGIKDMDNEGYTTVANTRVLNAKAFYGANSSGKSNVFKAVGMMRGIVIHSVRLNDNEMLPYDAFLLSDKEARPTRFEMSFVDDTDKFTYGFRYTAKRIEEEWLIAKFPNRSLKTLLKRTLDTIEIDEQNYPEGLSIKEGIIPLNNNRLFISLAAQLGGEISKRVIEWFRTKPNVISGLRDNDFSRYTKAMLHTRTDYKDEILAFISGMDVGFREVTTEQEYIDEKMLPKGLPAEIVATLKEHPPIVAYAKHSKLNANGEVVGMVDFDIDERESDGTRKLFNLAGPIVDTLRYGKSLFVDELDAKLHPLLTRNIVLLFMDPKKNKHGAQLIFATHDTNLLDLDIVRRDQIWFAEKDKVESTDIYSLVEFKDEDGRKVRNDRDIKRDYIRGRYGAIPFIGK